MELCCLEWVDWLGTLSVCSTHRRQLGLAQAVDEIERRLQQNRPWKVVKVPRDREDDPDAAVDRHFAAHPEDRDADVVIFHFTWLD